MNKFMWVQMIQLVEFAGKQGLIMKKEVFLEIINHDRVVPLEEQGTSDERHARDQVTCISLRLLVEV